MDFNKTKQHNQEGAVPASVWQSVRRAKNGCFCFGVGLNHSLFFFKVQQESLNRPISSFTFTNLRGVSTLGFKDIWWQKEYQWNFICMKCILWWAALLHTLLRTDRWTVCHSYSTGYLFHTPPFSFIYLPFLWKWLHLFGLHPTECVQLNQT